MSVVTVVLVAACVLCAGSVSDPGRVFAADHQLYDLTFPFDNETVYWPGTQPFVFTNQISRDVETYWYRANEFAAGEHGGTHLDAPSHFNKTGKPVGGIPPGDLVLSLVILDVSSKVQDNSDYTLDVHDMNLLEHVSINRPTLLLVKFGWSKFFYDKTAYLGRSETNNKLRFPGLSPEVVEWVGSRPLVRGIGVDTASLDPGSSETFLAHRAAAAAGIYGLENVKLTDEVPAVGCTVVVAPMLIAGGSGAPTRLLALCPRADPETINKK